MEHYEAAGADILFIESPETRDEMATIGKHFTKPLLANLVEGGRTPVLPHSDLEELGFKLAIYPATGFLAVGAALENVYAHLVNGRSSKVDKPLYDFEKFNRLMGFEEIWEMEERYRL